MKKFTVVAMLGFMMALASQVNAQSATLAPLTAGDTIITVAAKDTVTKTIPSTTGYSTLSIQVVTTKLICCLASMA